MEPGAPGESEGPSDAELEAALAEVDPTTADGPRLRRRPAEEEEPPPAEVVEEPPPAAAPTGAPKPRRWMISGQTQEVVDLGVGGAGGPMSPPADPPRPRGAVAAPTVVLPRRDAQHLPAPPRGRNIGSKIVTVVGLLVALGLIVLAVVLVRTAVSGEDLGVASGWRQSLDGRRMPLMDIPDTEAQSLFAREIDCGAEACLATGYKDSAYLVVAGEESATVSARNETGDERWSVEVEGSTVAPVAGVGDVVLFLTIAPDGTVQTVALATEDGRQVWAAGGSVLTFDGEDVLLSARRAEALGVEEGRRLLRIDAVTGENGWSGSTTSQVFAFAGEDMVTLEDGLVVVSEASEGDRKWTARVGADASAVAISGDTVAVAVGGDVRTFDRSDGDPGWTRKAALGKGAPPITALGTVGDALLVQGGDRVVAHQVEDGDRIWTGTTDDWGPLADAVVLDEDRVLTTDGKVFKVASVETGRLVGEAATVRGIGDEGTVLPGPVVAIDSDVLLVEEEGTVVAYAVDDLRTVWTTERKGVITAGGGLMLDTSAAELRVSN